MEIVQWGEQWYTLWKWQWNFCLEYNLYLNFVIAADIFKFAADLSQVKLPFCLFVFSTGLAAQWNIFFPSFSFFTKYLDRSFVLLIFSDCWRWSFCALVESLMGPSTSVEEMKTPKKKKKNHVSSFVLLFVCSRIIWMQTKQELPNLTKWSLTVRLFTSVSGKKWMHINKKKINELS